MLGLIWNKLLEDFYLDIQELGLFTAIVSRLVVLALIILVAKEIVLGLLRTLS